MSLSFASSQCFAHPQPNRIKGRKAPISMVSQNLFLAKGMEALHITYVCNNSYREAHAQSERVKEKEGNWAKPDDL